MSFDSIEFALFCPLIFLLYWYVGRGGLRSQNGILLLASYFFYGWWDWRFLSLILFSSVLDYGLGLAMQDKTRTKRKKLWLVTSIVANLGLLGFFKYYNFFAENFAEAFTLLGQPISPDTLDIVLPVGISFYTFQTMSYTIDVYRGKIKATKDLLSFMTYVSFFPQLVAGPIERATRLLPQFQKPRVFRYRQAVDGMRQILWGLFKKVVIADNCAEFVNIVFENPEAYSGSTLVLGAICFAFQIYGDFSGYSDIAIGTARLFGVDLMKNFAFPYFSRDISEFWRRWHISLSTWFRDYLYIPLGGSRGSTWIRARNTFIIFVVSGFWHGNKWTFIAWGALNALYFLPLLLANRNRKHLDIVAANRALPTLREFIGMGLTFALVTLAWILFRAESMSQVQVIFSKVFSSSLLTVPNPLIDPFLLRVLVLFITIEWLGRRREYAIETLGLNWYRPVRWGIYMGLVFLIFAHSGKPQEFIYFQF